MQHKRTHAPTRAHTRVRVCIYMYTHAHNKQIHEHTHTTDYFTKTARKEENRAVRRDVKFLKGNNSEIHLQVFSLFI